jgi:hypothetical protein
VKRSVRLERSIENAVLRQTKKHGVVSRKMNGFGFNSWPDRMFLVPGGKPLFVEYKRPGKRATPLQARLHAQLNKLGYAVEVHTTVEESLQALGIEKGKKK